MPNPLPLEKTILNLDLSKGVNERDRPEVGDPRVLLTRVENLVQNQTGGFTKRPGTPILGSYSGGAKDDQGTSIQKVTKLLRLKSGLGAISQDGKFYHYLENIGAFSKKLSAYPSMSVDGADLAVSSGPNGTPKVYAVASSTKYHAVAHVYGPKSTGLPQPFVSIFDRESGTLAYNYDISLDFGFTPDLTTNNKIQMAFVGDRYLHTYVVADDGISNGIWCSVLDLNAAVSSSSMGFALVLSSVAGALRDISVHTDRSYILFDDNATTGLIYSRSNANATLANTTVTDAFQISNSGDKLWVLDPTNLQALDLSTLAVAVAAGAHGKTVAASDSHMAVTSDNKCFVVKSGTQALGGSTISNLTVYREASTDGTGLSGQTVTLVGWKKQSAPFYDAGSSKMLLHVVKDSGLTVTPHAVINITDRAWTYVNAEVDTWPVVANLEPNLGVTNTVATLRYFSPNSYTWHPQVAIQTVTRGLGYAFVNLRSMGHADINTVVFGGQTYISGGTVCNYSGAWPTETGFIDYPAHDVAITGAVGSGVLSGAYKYVSVYRYVDETGTVTFSRTSASASITPNTQKGRINVVQCGLTYRDYLAWLTTVPPQSNVLIEVYRTRAGGTQFYLVASNQVGTPLTGLSTQALTQDAATGYWTADDNMSDATLISQPLLHRHPGVPNTPVDRYPPTCGNVICQHKDRIFLADAYGTRVYYSSYFVDGEAAWFNPVFSFFIHGGTGPITALASMDGRLFIFKKDSIFVVDGDGPPEGGVSGNEFSPPQKLAIEYGCVDHRSMAVTTDGIFYRSERGIELLTRALQNKWVGERVQNTVNDHPKTTGAVIDTSGRYHICVAVSDAESGQQVGVTGCELIYDVPGDVWTVSIHTDDNGLANACVQDVCKADLVGLGETVVYADSYGPVVKEDASTGLDRGSRTTPWVIETGWIRTGQQARQRLSKALFLAKKIAGANHAVRVSVAYDYFDTYTQLKTFEPDVINPPTIEELQVSISKPETLAVRLKFEELTPSDTVSYPVGNGRACDVLGIAVEVAAKGGVPTLSADQRG
jgi:hypothetical protein